MSERIKINNRNIFLIVALFAIVFFITIFVSMSDIEDYYEDYVYDSSYVKELDGIIVLAQEFSYSCNVTAMAVVKTYMGVETSESEIRNELGIENREKGMLPNDYLRYSNKAFNSLSYSVSLLNPKTEGTIIKIIVNSLSNGLPAVMYYSTENAWDKPNYDTHYSVIYGIDIKNEIVKISNSYGYLEELTFTELYEGLSFKNYKSEPIYHRLGRMAGMIKKNNLFILEKTGLSQEGF